MKKINYFPYALQSHVLDCAQRVEDILDFQLCAEGVHIAMRDEDFEKVSSHCTNVVIFLLNGVFLYASIIYHYIDHCRNTNRQSFVKIFFFSLILTLNLFFIFDEFFCMYSLR